MEYKLAKDLKEKGFPQKKQVIICVGEEHCWYNENGQNPVTRLVGENWVYIPTLEELIEACGSSFYLLRRLNQGTRARIQWEATTEDYTQGEGETKKEAVARLWLALQK